MANELKTDGKIVYVSITGLKLKRQIYFFSFWWHAVRSMMQAKSAEGNLRADARTINGVQHTLSVWKDEQAMRKFLITGPHLKAMRAFSRIASGKTFGFSTYQVPEWSEVHRLWVIKGIEYNKVP